MARKRLGVLVAGVFLAATLEAQAPTPRPVDLLHRLKDLNGFPLNPFWQTQDTNPASRPDIAKLCGLHRPRGPAQIPPVVREYFQNPDCTSQLALLSIDLAGEGAYQTGCRIAALPAPRFAGHLNWFPVTVTGLGSWLHIDKHDHDVNLLLVPDGSRGIVAPGLTAHAPESPEPDERPAYKLEFDNRETFAAIAASGASTPLWSSLFASKRAPEELLSSKLYVATGLYGLDAQHDYHAELHPVWGLAVRVHAVAGQESWLVFARNSGNEGGCSSRQQIPLPPRPDGSFGLSFELPIGLGVPGAVVSATFYNLHSQLAPHDVRVDSDAMGNRVVRLTIPFPGDRSASQLVFGEVRVSSP